ncbi:MAG: type IV pilus biogenesis/stability protein PilW [Pseudomonadota bacterium]
MNGARWPRATFLAAALVCLTACVTEGPVRENPGSPEEAASANLQLGAAYLRKGDLESALDKLQKAVDLDEKNAQAHATLALAYERVGLVDESDAHYKKALRVSDNNPIIDNMYGAYLCRNGSYDEAETYLLRAARNPRYRTPEAAYANAGVCAVRSERLDEAEAFFRSALRSNPRYVDALWNMASLSYELDRDLQARAFLERLAATTPLPSTALWLAHRVERRLGNEPAARRYAEELKSKFPTSKETAELLEAERHGG